MGLAALPRGAGILHARCCQGHLARTLGLGCRKRLRLVARWRHVPTESSLNIRQLARLLPLPCHTCWLARATLRCWLVDEDVLPG
jgi:hypothetical protein